MATDFNTFQEKLGLEYNELDLLRQGLRGGTSTADDGVNCEAASVEPPRERSAERTGADQGDFEVSDESGIWRGHGVFWLSAVQE